MKIALNQFNPLVGDVAGNTRKILSGIQKAKAVGAELVCFHEMALLGYPPRDLLELPYLIQKCEEAIASIAKSAVGIAVVFGAVEKNPGPGKPLSNIAVWCEEGKVRTVVRKSLLPSYDVFDETRYFEPGSEREIITFRGMQWGVSVCEDIWYDPSLWKRQLYPSDPIDDLVRKGAQIILNISASPYSMGKFAQRKKVLTGLATKNKVTVMYVNQVGGNDELIFDGGSMVIDPHGQLKALAPFFKEGMTIAELGLERVELPKIPDDLELLEEGLVCGLKDYVKKCGFQKVALGLSGGIDSAVTAYLAAKALGPKNVLGLLMPSRFSSKGSLLDSKALAKNLQIEVKEISIQSLHATYEKTLKKVYGRKKPDKTEENIQSRIRGNLLMAVSNKLGYMILSTGNKSEVGVGFGTLYGDMIGGLAVISDVPKTTVYALARWINRKKEIIPQVIIDKVPSAELKPNQTDQDTLPPYEELDGILKAFVEDLKNEEEIIQMGFKPEAVKKVIRMILTAEYKRRQLPPGLKVTSKAFGMGRRFPIACKI